MSECPFEQPVKLEEASCGCCYYLLSEGHRQKYRVGEIYGSINAEYIATVINEKAERDAKALLESQP